MLDRELGGVEAPRWIIEKQSGPECGFEAVENVIQLVHPVGNNISEQVLKRIAILSGFAEYSVAGWALNPTGYPLLLARYGIASTWHEFEPNQLVQALGGNRVAIAVVHPATLDPELYRYAPRDELHAIVVTRFGVDAHGRVLRYTGIDSNCEGSERHWRWDRFQNAVTATNFRVLITDLPVPNSRGTNYDILVRRSAR